MQAWREQLTTCDRTGVIESYDGMKITAQGPPHTFPGEICDIFDRQQKKVLQAEVLRFDQGKVSLMPLDETPVQHGYSIRGTGKKLLLPLGLSLQGRIVNALVQPLDDKGPIHYSHYMPAQGNKINPLHRKSIQESLMTGIHALDGLLPLGKGQRTGIFAGSGVGKSVLTGMIAEHITCDVIVIALIGERGREVKDFIHNHLSEEARKKTVLVISCSDESALIKRQAAWTATTIAEFFAEQGKDVVLFMDSITRFAQAQREIGLNLDEPPTARGYTPSVFAKLPPLLERAGNFIHKGSITGIYTVLVDGDDFNEPIADTMRSLLDGHIILSRELAQEGHYPAINILHSVSRLARQLFTPEEQNIAKDIISSLALYEKNKDLVEIGACVAGNNPALDTAIQQRKKIYHLLKHDHRNSLKKDDVFKQFKEILTCKK